MRQRTGKKLVKFNFKALAAKIFPGWEEEPVFASKSMRALCKTYVNQTPVELVKIAGGRAGLGDSDMAQEFGGTLGK